MGNSVKKQKLLQILELTEGSFKITIIINLNKIQKKRCTKWKKGEVQRTAIIK